METLVALAPEDQTLLSGLRLEPVPVARRADILSLRDRPSFAFVVLSGWAARYGVRADGSRRITGFLLPGDFCGIHAVSTAAMDHAILALTDCEIGRIHRSELERLSMLSPTIDNALWHSKLVEEAILRKWLLNSADAYQAIAHLLCELHARAGAVGLVQDRRFHLPLTQEELGDAVGITPVHTNRVIQRLRGEGLITFAYGDLLIEDVAALRRAGQFDPDYLRPW